MKKFLVVWLLLGLSGAGLANAQHEHEGGEEPERRMGKNSGVVLYLSIAPELIFEEDETFRDLSATPYPEEAVVSGEVSSVPRIAYILASYPEGAVPDLMVATFGLRYTKGIKIVRYGITHESMPIATRDWPLSGQGISVALTGGPDTSMVSEIGWIAIRAEVPGTVELVPHRDPKMGARIVSHTPRLMVPIAEMGYLGFEEPGYAPIPHLPGPFFGATCVGNSICMEMSELEANFYGSQGGDEFLWLGEETTCIEVARCGENAPTGVCCLDDGSCQILDHKGCAQLGGSYMGDGTECAPGICGAAAEDGSPSESEGR